MKDGNALKIGDELRPAGPAIVSYRARVDGVTPNYVKLRWGAKAVKGDVLEKHSPLWQLLELIE